MQSSRPAMLPAIAALTLQLLADMACADITVFRARTVITMDESMPRAEAVAVADGRIIAVGSVASMRPWLDAQAHRFDDRLSDKVIMPGLIDNHLHPPLAAMLLNTRWITPREWNIPGHDVVTASGHDEYLAALRHEFRNSGAAEPFITWGFHEIWHGDVTRVELDRISADRPIIVWQRSFHEVIANTAGLRWLGVDPAGPSPHPEVDLDRGSFSEQGLVQYAIKPLATHLLAPERLGRAMHNSAVSFTVAASQRSPTWASADISASRKKWQCRNRHSAGRKFLSGS